MYGLAKNLSLNIKQEITKMDMPLIRDKETKKEITIVEFINNNQEQKLIPLAGKLSVELEISYFESIWYTPTAKEAFKLLKVGLELRKKELFDIE